MKRIAMTAKVFVLALFMSGAAIVGTTSSASAASEVGGVNVQYYCSSVLGGGWRAVNVNITTSNPYSWRCAFYIPNYGYTYRGVDMNYACRLQYGSSSYAGLKYYNFYGWRCYR